LIALCLKEIVFDVDFTVNVPDFQTHMAQFLACALLHIELVTDVHQAVMMLKYISDHEEDFTNSFLPMCIALMQLTSNFAAEIVNIVVLLTRHDLLHCLEHFVAFEMLTKIDNIYYLALPLLPIMEEIEVPLAFSKRGKKWADRTPKSRLVHLVYKFNMLFYELLYYYMTPFTIIVVPFLFAYQGGENSH